MPDREAVTSVDRQANVLLRMLYDESFRGEFLADREAALASAGLSADERAPLLSLPATALAVDAAERLRGLRGQLSRTFPQTMERLGQPPELGARLVVAICHGEALERLIRAESGLVDVVEEFVCAMRELDERPGVRELCQLEADDRRTLLAWMEAGCPAPRQQPVPDDLERRCPRVAAGVEVRSYRVEREDGAMADRFRLRHRSAGLMRELKSAHVELLRELTGTRRLGQAAKTPPLLASAMALWSAGILTDAE
jgi:hypothetical protein